MTTREVEHEITITAPAPEVYRLLAEVGNWPLIFPPTLHADRVEGDGTWERIRIWATANGEPKNWTSWRELDPEALRITFRQEVTTPPVAAMGGTWIIEPLGARESRVRLRHDYRAVGDDPHDLVWIDRAVDTNSRKELAALKENVEAAHAARELTFSFEDSVLIDGSAKDAYDFVHDAHLWPQRLPHVATVHLTETSPGLQTLRMDTQAKDGTTHTTSSHRITFPHHTIIYKQTTLPALMTHHTGRWTFHPTPQGLTATSHHTITLNPHNIATVLGPHTTTHDARTYLHTALSTNSLATLHHAKAFAENRRRP
ncbi:MULTISPECIES: aromatase/cyclase [unclassified Streptomyces]|uniref:aromatase/cyclase n=1 Tax=unclassified Streptomyces TaxID=2593676 RepID=UPI001660DF64|nr:MULTISPECIES: aromatase/cyclase [unclassified Streptomyces]MBD0707908.1 cyclase [Streptomyces sp. CBMA291]MBD0717609.1 cyclase [Streptomyces sp. CBMA370]